MVQVEGKTLRRTTLHIPATMSGLNGSGTATRVEQGVRHAEEDITSRKPITHSGVVFPPIMDSSSLESELSRKYELHSKTIEDDKRRM